MVASTGVNPALNFVSNMGDDLNRTTQIVATALTTQNRLVNLAAGEVIILGHFGTQETFIVTKIQISLGSVLGNIDLTMLIRTHGSRINIEIGVELKNGDTQTSGLEHSTQRSG